MNNADMPAAPIFNERGGVNDLTDGTQDAGYIAQPGRQFSIGLTKREEFAKAAMMGLLPMAHNGAQDRCEQIAELAVRQADALLAALEKTNEE